MGKCETILLNPGRSKFNGIRTTIISADWIELMDKLWNSSGRFSQDSLQWQSSMRFNWWWENYSVNQRTWHAASSFMTMFNDIVRDAKGNDELCVNNSRKKNVCGKIPSRSLVFPGSEKTWYGTYDCKPDGSWNRTAEKMLMNFAETDHPIFRGTSALERGDLRSKESGKKSIHFNGSTQKCWIASPSGNLRRSAQYLRSR